MKKEQDNPPLGSKPRKSFILYTDYSNIIDSFNDAEAGILLKAIMHYETRTELPVMSGEVDVAFNFIKHHLDRDSDSYMETLEKKKAAGRKGGLIRAGHKAQADQEYAAFIEQTKATLSSTKQNLAFQDDNDNDSDNGNDNDIGNDNGRGIIPQPGSSTIRPAVKTSGYYHTPYSEKKALNMARWGIARGTDYNSLVDTELIEQMNAES